MSVELIEQNIRTAFKELVVWFKEYWRLSPDEQKAVRHKLYQHEGKPGRLLMDFSDWYHEWYRTRSWYEIDGVRVPYCIDKVGDSMVVVHGPPEWVGKLAVEFYSATKDFKHGGVK